MASIIGTKKGLLTITNVSISPITRSVCDSLSIFILIKFFYLISKRLSLQNAMILFFKHRAMNKVMNIYKNYFSDYFLEMSTLEVQINLEVGSYCKENGQYHQIR